MKALLNTYVAICIVAFVLKYAVLFIVRRFVSATTDTHHLEHQIEHTVRLILIIAFGILILLASAKTDN